MDLFLLIPLVLTAGLAYANGANDVSRGIATLVGSRVTDYRRALIWGTVWTFAGSALAIVVSIALVKTFTRGVLTETSNIGDTGRVLAISVMIAASLWVFLATRTGLPVSTTHAIVGSLCGAGSFALGTDGILWGSVFGKIVLPMVISPLVSMMLAYVSTPLVLLGLSGWGGHCFCVFPARSALLTVEPSGTVQMTTMQPGLVAAVDVPACDTPAEPRILSLRMGPNTFHWLTAGWTSFARGLNDAPKVTALMVGYMLLSGETGIGLEWVFATVALSMTAGAYLNGRRVTASLAEKVTRMDHLQGFSANLITSILVTVAAHFGLPVSTTHVSTSAIVGMGLHNGVRSINWKMVSEMLTAWVVTAPLSALIAVCVAFLLSTLL